MVDETLSQLGGRQPDLFRLVVFFMAWHEPFAAATVPRRPPIRAYPCLSSGLHVDCTATFLFVFTR